MVPELVWTNNLLYLPDDASFLILKLAYDDDKTIRQTISYQKLDNEKKSISSNKGIFIKN